MGDHTIQATQRVQLQRFEDSPKTESRRDDVVVDIVERVRSPQKAPDVRFDGWLVGAGGRVFPPETPLDAIEPVRPNNGAPVRSRVILVNGIMTDVALQASDMQALANTGVEVIGVHNATEGLTVDLWQCVTDKLDLAENAATNTLAQLLYGAVSKSEPIHVIGHSQGALIVEVALERLRDHLIRDGDPIEKIDHLALPLVTVETFGGASAQYTDGPRYSHYLNCADMVPMLTGLGLFFARAGRDAGLNSFTKIDKPHDMPAVSEGVSNYFARFVDRTTHGPRDIYFGQRNRNPPPPADQPVPIRRKRS